MTDRQKAFRSAFAKEMEVHEDELEPDFVLESSPLWDSMGVMTTIALIDKHYGITVPGEGLTACKTYAELTKLIEEGI